MLSRQEAMQIHDAVCEKLGVDDVAFQYQTTSSEQEPDQGPRGESRGFAIQLQREQGRGTFNVTLDKDPNVQDPGRQNPVRFLVQYTWPPTRQHVSEDLDLASEAVFETLGEDWQRVLAEARVRGQVEAQGGSGVDYLAEQVLGFEEADLENLDAPVSFATVGYETPAQDPASDDQLSSPKREVTLEVLREDPRSLYVEVVSQWPQFAAQAKGQQVQINPQRLRQFTAVPSDYVEDTVDYIRTVLLPLFSG